jgi:hypothetical protein
MNTKIINKKTVSIAVVLQIIVFSFIIFFLYNYGNIFDKSSFGNQFFHFGPSNSDININIFGNNIDSWKKWTFFMITLIFIEIINTYSYKIYKNWYNNLVKDPKSKKILFSKKITLLYISVWKLMTWFSKMLQLTLFITTKQLQFTIPKFLSRLIISNIIDYKYIENKDK